MKFTFVVIETLMMGNLAFWRIKKSIGEEKILLETQH